MVSIGEVTRRIGRGSWCLAVDLLDLAEQQSTRCDARAYNTALSVCKESASGWCAAGKFLEHLDRKELQPTVVSYGASMGTYGRSSRWECVFGLLQDRITGQIVEISYFSVEASIQIQKTQSNDG
eukprot:Skav210860  [mRNA]  locus=scaffold2829:365417:366045:- [translate_table: standard]